jgi:SAM-dependent methyltransferase
VDDSRCQGQAEESNRALWDEMARVHIGAYKEVELLRRGEEILDPVELRELGDVGGKTMLHLQCHIGTDTLAWARRGAVVTGVDFSGQAIACAEGLRDELGLEARFLESNVYDLRVVLDEKSDVVYTSRGILCWLRDLEKWARAVSGFLKFGEIFYLLDFHQGLNELEECPPGRPAFAHRYFHQAEPMVYTLDETNERRCPTKMGRSRAGSRAC